MRTRPRSAATARTRPATTPRAAALPTGGLRDKIRLKLYGPEPDNNTLPETHTCTRELHLPNYSSAQVLRAKLGVALEHVDDGFLKQ